MVSLRLFSNIDDNLANDSADGSNEDGYASPVHDASFVTTQTRKLRVHQQ